MNTYKIVDYIFAGFLIIELIALVSLSVINHFTYSQEEIVEVKLIAPPIYPKNIFDTHHFKVELSNKEIVQLDMRFSKFKEGCRDGNLFFAGNSLFTNPPYKEIKCKIAIPRYYLHHIDRETFILSFFLSTVLFSVESF